MSEETRQGLPFDIPTDAPRIIKVIGVGGGGSNAVENMYEKGIHNVSFAICNTDRQALFHSNIPVKVQLGESTTEGLGAGNDPNVARLAAEESRESIKQLFEDGTKMAFITAGMGGGTGTGAAPVVAEIAKSMNILTIGIVTIPFRFEMGKKIKQALRGVAEIAKHVDALLVINNERLLDIYPKLDIEEGFRKVDEVLTTATKSIAEIITARGKINLDFRDVKKVLKNGGVAIMSYGIESGENRLDKAFRKAMHSPLLNNNDIYKSKKLLFNIYYNPNEPMLVEEINAVNHFMEQFEYENIEVIWGLSKDCELNKGEVKVTVLATGFGMNNIPGMEPLIEAQKEEEERISQEERRAREAEEKRLSEMEKNFYKEEYKMFIFENDEMNDEELISAIDNSPTYKRTVQELDTFKSMIQARNNTPAEVVVTNEEEEQEENNEEEETI
ncbi:MAG: cell division protein FtsZ [Bacteroidaceae bacterium]|nr:cell division protein FtsZ [Bacteroidaceae bacterium]MBQ8256927.1 cell division protein FtsZ [Bacteroidaceae bacterium]